MTFPTSAAMQQAVALHQRGELAKASQLYDAVLRQEPDHPDALHLSGVLARQRGDAGSAVELIGRALAAGGEKAIMLCNLGAALQDLRRHEEALASFDRALSLQPQYAMAMCNRGNALRNLERFEEALESYGSALRMQPAYPEALLNRALVLQQLARHDEALDSFGAALSQRPGWAEALHGAAVSLLARGDVEQALEGFDRALQRRPEYAEAWCSRGGLLLRAQEAEAAEDSYRHALALRPQYARAQLGLANSLRALGRKDEAIAAYRSAGEMGADAATVGYMLASLGAQDAPSASPSAYVTALFDQYAAKFDRHLQEVLSYRTPALLADALRPHVAESLDVLDLGCGTGLCAPLLRPLARRLEGVDLSPRMLEKARELELYDALYCADMVETLRTRPARYDLLAAADVMVYVGELETVLAAAWSALRPGGIMAFSVETGSVAEGYALQASGRYAHSAACVRAAAAKAGFDVLALDSCVLRRDAGSDVQGLLAVLRRSA
ncbi:tetratricopeptide repeat protein [Massilia endophytica]|uniref:tetratricopeptide repeat protein n=1 Tax=Massilia endophytica TaxID=2899220 RepID=UPI001E3B6A4F|nr:tetratricopeptide repeat protein [Massilia endophytica]UGQ46847.1 tetratricopeptide repeat protein [Massilia endophytica]